LEIWASMRIWRCGPYDLNRGESAEPGGWF
jgi:hypothetical protein